MLLGLREPPTLNGGKEVSMNVFNLVSPTSNRQYSMQDVLRKMYERATVYMDKLSFSGFTKKCVYGSRDALLSIENLRVSDSLWCDSLNFSLSLKTVVHFTKRGKLSFGAGTFDENVPNPYTKYETTGEISVWINEDKKETVAIDNTFLANNHDIFVEILNIAMVTSIFKRECLNEDTEDIEMF